jgi:hypothetical protein
MPRSSKIAGASVVVELGSDGKSPVDSMEKKS